MIRPIRLWPAVSRKAMACVSWPLAPARILAPLGLAEWLDEPSRSSRVWQRKDIAPACEGDQNGSPCPGSMKIVGWRPRRGASCPAVGNSSKAVEATPGPQAKQVFFHPHPVQFEVPICVEETSAFSLGMRYVAANARRRRSGLADHPLRRPRRPQRPDRVHRLGGGNTRPSFRPAFPCSTRQESERLLPAQLRKTAKHVFQLGKGQDAKRSDLHPGGRRNLVRPGVKRQPTNPLPVHAPTACSGPSRD